MTAAATRKGQIMGTAAYMSPEQATGRGIDKRSDIWAFGCCLYEALTGARPFLGESTSETLAKVLEASPDWSALPAEVPPGLSKLLRRCLERKPADRLRDIGDARLELREARDTSEAAPGGPLQSPENRGWRPLLTLAVGALVLVAATAGIAVWVLKSDPPPPGQAINRFVLSRPGLSPGPPGIIWATSGIAIASDGRHIAYTSWEPGEGALYCALWTGPRGDDLVKPGAFSGPRDGDSTPSSPRTAGGSLSWTTIPRSCGGLRSKVGNRRESHTCLATCAVRAGDRMGRLSSAFWTAVSIGWHPSVASPSG